MHHIAESSGEANTFFPQTRWTQMCSSLLPRTQQPGKSCHKSARKLRAASKLICAVQWWWGKQGRSWMIGSILSMEMFAYTTEGELPVHSDKLYEGSPSSHKTVWQLEPTFCIHTLHFSLKGFTEQTCVFICNSKICINYSSGKISKGNLKNNN